MASMNGTRVANLVTGQSIMIGGNPVTVQRSIQKDNRTYILRYIDVYGDHNAVEFDCNHKFENNDDEAYIAFLKEIDKLTKGITH